MNHWQVKSGKQSSNSSEPVNISRRSFLAGAAGLALGSSFLLGVPARTQALEAAKWSVVNGTIIKNSKPVFPFGIYHVSHYPQQKERRAQDLTTIASLGFNMVHTPVDENDRAFLDLAARAGIDLCVEFNGPPEKILRLFKGHPALAFLGTFDDVDAHKRGRQPSNSPNDVRSKSAELKSLAPDALTYISGGYPDYLPRYTKSADVIAMQAYPIPAEPLSAVTTGYFSKVIPEAQKSGTPFIANLQTFGWHGKHRMPTAAEVRNMTYQAVIAGAKGIIYYTFYDYDPKNPNGALTDLNKHPALLKELKRIALEINSLRGTLLLGKHAILKTGLPEVFAARWDSAKGQTFIIANAGAAKAAPQIPGMRNTVSLDPGDVKIIKMP
jgi:hypothetical protein